MRTVLFRTLIVIAMVPLLLAFVSVAAFIFMAVMADKVLPDARWGNCWTYAAARWWRLGGYIALRPSDGIALIGGIPIPHAVWVPELTGEVRMTYPVDPRIQNVWMPLQALLFAYTVWHRDAPHGADWVPSSTPPEWQDTLDPS